MNENCPKAYKSGVQDFYGREFFVSPAVLIPRPETEMIVDEVFRLVGKPILSGIKPSPAVLSENIRILDVGTGSGCVAITLKKEIPSAEVFAVDVSSEAIEVAKKNAEKFDAEVEFSLSDLLSEVRGDFDIIVANLPYVDRNWKWLDREKLSFEPEVALFAENEGVELIFKLLEQAVSRGKYLILEADPSQHEKIREKAESLGYFYRGENGFILVFSTEKV